MISGRERAVCELSDFCIYKMNSVSDEAGREIKTEIEFNAREGRHFVNQKTLKDDCENEKHLQML